MSSFYNNPWSQPYVNPWSEGNNNYDRWYESEPLSLLSPPNGSKKKKITNFDEIEVTSRADIVIVIDPGHGNTKGNTGSTFVKAYKHKVKGKDGKPKVDDDKKEIIKETKIEDLPAYVKAEVTKDKANWTWITKRISDNSKLERDIVWDISEKLKKLLEDAGYTAYLTRTNKTITGNDNRKSRNDFANNKDAHYFISVHADGSYDFDKSGSHAIYRSSSDSKYTKRQKKFAEDVFKYYTVVAKKNSPKKRTDLQVLSPTQNDSYRKSLVELGFVTNPSDYKDMTDNKDLIAKQIAKGIEFSISKIYYTSEQELVGYLFNNTVYRTEEGADAAFDRFQREREEYMRRNNIDGISGETVLTPQPQYTEKRTKLKPVIK